jgi:hypothetical protein
MKPIEIALRSGEKNGGKWWKGCTNQGIMLANIEMLKYLLVYASKTLKKWSLHNDHFVKSPLTSERKSIKMILIQYLLQNSEINVVSNTVQLNMAYQNGCLRRVFWQTKDSFMSTWFFPFWKSFLNQDNNQINAVILKIQS